MTILLISPNVEMLPDPVFPIGAACISAALKRAGLDCKCLDLCFEQDPQAAIRDIIEQYQPRIVALSLRNVDNVSYPHSVSYLPHYRKIVQFIRQCTCSPIVLGGSGFTLLPEAILDYLEADYAIAGEGEIAFVELAGRLLEHGRQPGREAGQAKTDRPIIAAGAYMIKDLDTLPMPDHAGFDSTLYLKRGGMGSLQTKRGCPFKCIYCTYPLIEGRKVRMRSAQHICDEIEILLDNGMDTIFIVDNEFNYPIGHAQDVCRQIIRRKLKFNWSCYANPGLISEPLVDLMKSAGCTGLEFGTDAACDLMLRNMGKSFKVEDILNASRICREADMPFCHCLLLGGPGETMQTVEQSLETIAQTQATAIICMVGIRIFPKTRLAQIALEEGRLDETENFLEPVFYLSDAVAGHIRPYLKTFSKSHPDWIFPGLQININTALQSKLRRLGVKGPLWEYMHKFKKRTWRRTGPG
ncbi:MAG: radical SAM protein [Desulfobacteraceae bacterium]|nr:radical SAM protein [Desulfobacteraceae bacterium]